MRTQSIPVKWLDGGLASCRGPDQQDPHRNAALSKSRWGRQGMQQGGAGSASQVPGMQQCQGWRKWENERINAAAAECHRQQQTRATRMSSQPKPGGSSCVCVLHGYYPQARNPDSSRNSCWIWNSSSSTDGSTMPPHPRAYGPHHSSAETSLPRKPSVPESISSGGFEPTTSGVSRDLAPYLTPRPTTVLHWSPWQGLPSPTRQPSAVCIAASAQRAACLPQPEAVSSEQYRNLQDRTA